MKAIKVGLLLLLTSFVTCEQNPNYLQIGRGFVQQFYAYYDVAFQRSSVRSFYDINESVLLYAGELFQGADKIMEKFTAGVSNVVQRNITFTDVQPTNDAGMIINVFGRILYSDSTAANWTPHFTEMFVIKPRFTMYYIQNQHFRSSVAVNSSSISINDGLRFV